MSRRVLNLVVPLALVTAFANIAWLGDLEPVSGAPFVLPLWAIVLGFVVAELLAVDIESRSEAHSVNFVELMYVAALLLGTPVTVVLGRVIAMFLRMGVIRRQSPNKLIVNVVVAWVEATVACLVFYPLVGGGSPAEPASWVVIYAATICAYLVSAVVVTAAITIFSGFPGRQIIRHVLRLGGLVAVANTTLGIIIVGSLWTSSYPGLLVVGVVVGLFLLYRTHMALSERHKNLETLHDFTRSLDGSVDLPELEREVVEGARSILRGEHGALLLPPMQDGLPGTRLLIQGDTVTRTNISPEELSADLAVLLPASTSRLYGPGEPLPGWLAAIGLKDAAHRPPGH